MTAPKRKTSNIARALRPGGRLVLLVWQRREDNEWATAIDHAVAGQGASRAPTALDPFSLGDPAATQLLLERAGFDGIRFAGIREPVFYGRDVPAALQLVRSFQAVGEATGADQRLRDLLAAHHRDERGVLFDSRAWIITAAT